MSVNNPTSTGPTPHALWLSSNSRKRKPSPPPPRTEEELIDELIHLFSFSGLLNHTPRPHPDDISRVRSLLLKAWDEVLCLEQDDQKTAPRPARMEAIANERTSPHYRPGRRYAGTKKPGGC